MARFGVGDAEKYGGQGGGGFFRLADDGNTAKVRFLYNGIDDVEGYAVHEVEVDGKKRYVNCLREYGAPKDDCPFCANNQFVTVKYFIPIYNIDEDRTQIWERGKKFGNKISSICARYSNLVTHTFEIERCGKQGDTATTYEIYETGADDTKLEEFEVPEVLGGTVLDKDAEEMQYYIQHGIFPDEGGGEQAIRRRGQGGGATQQRRTPATSRRGEAF